jgi:hypothetical protein
MDTEDWTTVMSGRPSVGGVGSHPKSRVASSTVQAVRKRMEILRGFNRIILENPHACWFGAAWNRILPGIQDVFCLTAF